MGRVSRNGDVDFTEVFTQVTSRMGRVSRNLEEADEEDSDDVTSRMGRVSRNPMILDDTSKTSASRPAWGV